MTLLGEFSSPSLARAKTDYHVQKNTADATEQEVIPWCPIGRVTALPAETVGVGGPNKRSEGGGSHPGTGATGQTASNGGAGVCIPQLLYASPELLATASTTERT